jgi:tetratricopeptide (TPR) repeat protein
MDEKPRRAVAGQSIVMLLVGALIGFAAGYFAAGGGRPEAPVVKAGTPAEAASGDRLADLTKSVARDPENPELLMDLGNLYYDREDWDKAIAAYEKARRKAPKNANLLSDLGAAHRNRGEFDLAVAYFQKARESDPNHWQSLLNWVLVETFDRKDAKQAQRAFDNLKKQYSEIPQLDKIQEKISGLRAGT